MGDAMSLLHNRGFVLLWSGQFLGILADWSLRTAVLIWVYKLTRSGLAASLVGLAEALPLLALALVAGVFVDRWSRAYTMAGAGRRAVCGGAGAGRSAPGDRRWRDPPCRLRPTFTGRHPFHACAARRDGSISGTSHNDVHGV
jgi:hypothetical protein